jgi:hypothetical protein
VEGVKSDASIEPNFIKFSAFQCHNFWMIISKMRIMLYEKFISNFVLFRVAQLFVGNLGLGWPCYFMTSSWDMSFRYHMDSLSFYDVILKHELPCWRFTNQNPICAFSTKQSWMLGRKG